jgi:hypothetical protein
MAPWLTARRRVPLAEVATTFRIPIGQAEADVLLIGMLGVPPYTGGFLVEVSLDGDDVIAHPQPFLSRPPRLTPAEGFGLLTAGRALLAVPGAGTQSLAFAADSLRADGVFLLPASLGTRLGAHGRYVSDYDLPRPGPAGQAKVEAAWHRAGFVPLADNVVWKPADTDDGTAARTRRRNRSTASAESADLVPADSRASRAYAPVTALL